MSSHFLSSIRFTYWQQSLRIRLFHTLFSRIYSFQIISLKIKISMIINRLKKSFSLNFLFILNNNSLVFSYLYIRTTRNRLFIYIIRKFSCRSFFSISKFIRSRYRISCFILCYKQSSESINQEFFRIKTCLCNHSFDMNQLFHSRNISYHNFYPF